MHQPCRKQQSPTATDGFHEKKHHYPFVWQNAKQVLTLWVSKLDTSKYFKEEHSENIAFISVTLQVLKWDKSRDVKDAHAENIDSDLVTFSILKFEISRIFKESQSENILVISVTNEVLKEDKSIDSNWLHPKNHI